MLRITEHGTTRTLPDVKLIGTICGTDNPFTSISPEQPEDEREVRPVILQPFEGLPVRIEYTDGVTPVRAWDEAA